MDRFKNALGTVPGTWCDLADNNPTQGVNLSIDFSDISVVVDAFKGKDYPFSGPSAPADDPWAKEDGGEGLSLLRALGTRPVSVIQEDECPAAWVCKRGATNA